MENLNDSKYISNQQLLNNYLSSPMEDYFYKKLSLEKPNAVKTKICELLKYLILFPYSKGQIPFNEELDTLWHLWILQTKQYRELMDKLPGGQFIHHSSNDYLDESMPIREGENEINRQVSFLVSYVYNFGNFSEETVIFCPMAINIMSLRKFNIEELNTYLKNIAYEFS